MGPFLIFLGILLVGLLILAVIVVGMYNGLVTLRNAFRNAFAQVDVQLKRRHDLIPNLVETAKGYLAHESGTLTAVIEARAKATQANVRLVVSENYPQLKADTQMRALMEELTSTENRIAFARQAYNDAVLAYNNGRETFPQVLVANTFGFVPADFFKVESEAERAAPSVKF